MTNTWVREEATRQIKATCERDRKRDDLPKGGHSPCCHAEEVAESCLRAGLLEAAQQLEAYAAHIRTLWPNSEYEDIVKTWDIAAADLRALAGEEPSHE